MRTNIKTIIFTSICSIIFLVTTYFICLNISYAWFEIKWLSNNFLLTIFSGLFASMMVVLICEIQKYHLSKTETETNLYNGCLEILAGFETSKQTLTYLKENNDQIVTKGLLEDVYKHILKSIDKYLDIDYVTCNKKNQLYIENQHFATFLLQYVRPTSYDFIFLDLAINEQKIENLQQCIPENNVFAKGNLLKVINILLDKFEICIDGILEFMKKIDYSGRFKFEERYNQIQSDKDFYKISDVADFIEKNNYKKEEK